MKDYVQKAYCFNQTVRIYAASTTNLVEKARQLHGLWPTTAAALGRTLTISAIMSTMYKSNEHLTIRIDGGGPAGPILVEASNGKVKGYLSNPEVFLQYNNGKLNVGAAVGNNGYLNITKNLNMREPFTSTSELVSGEIAEDFTYYFATSEQIPSSVGLGVIVEPDNSVSAAGGFIIQVMPGCSEETLNELENILKNLKPCSQMILDGYSPEDIIKEIVGSSYQLLESKELEYVCDCSFDRFYAGIKTLGVKELTEIKDEDKKAEVTCHFCKKVYQYTEQDLENMINEIKEESN